MGQCFQGFGSCFLAVVGAEVVPAAGQLHDGVGEAGLPVVELVADNPAALHAAQDMLDGHARPVQHEVVVLMKGTQFLAPPSLDGTAQRPAVAQEQLAARKLPPGPFLGATFLSGTDPGRVVPSALTLRPATTSTFLGCCP